MILRLLLLLCVTLYGNVLYAHDNLLRVYFLQKMTAAAPGDTVTFQVLINNQDRHQVILVDSLELPEGWTPLPNYPLYGHLSPFQNYTKHIAFTVPYDAPDGVYNIGYTTWARDNIAIQQRDFAVVNVRRPTCRQPPAERVESLPSYEPCEIDDYCNCYINYFAPTAVRYCQVVDYDEMEKTTLALCVNDRITCGGCLAIHALLSAKNIDHAHMIRFSEDIRTLAFNESCGLDIEDYYAADFADYLQYQESMDYDALFPEKPVKVASKRPKFISEGLLFAVASPPQVETVTGKVLFFSTRLANMTAQEICKTIQMECPKSWLPLPTSQIETVVDSHNASVKIFGVKIPDGAIAGDYPLTFGLEGSTEKETIIVSVLPEIHFDAYFENLQPIYCNGEPMDLTLICNNDSNVPINICLQAKGDPICRGILTCAPFQIPPHEKYEVPITIRPTFDLLIDKQFLLLDIHNIDTGEKLCHHTLGLAVEQPGSGLDDDLYRRIPGYMKAIAFGDTGCYGAGVEFAGGGLVLPERNRYVDFFFRLPTRSQSCYYNADQVLYTGIWEDDWSIDLGDTVYNLSALTQRYRYGRGAGFDITKTNWSYGAHYTQNPWNSHCCSKESCGYMAYSPLPGFEYALNYMHKDLKHTLTSNILTVSAELPFPTNGKTELEVGNNFVSHKFQHSTAAFRLATRGRWYDDYWYDIEKVYAGKSFCGFYQHLDLLSSSVDVPLGQCTRGNLSYNRLKQNFDTPCCFVRSCHHDEENFPLLLRQRQFNGRITHTFCQGLSVSANALWLRAHDAGEGCTYDFDQEWGGFSLNYMRNRFNLLANCSFGRQKDYLTGHTTSLLQAYYVCLGRDLTDHLYTSLFYEGGNTDYYDARPWRTVFGGSLRYRYGRGSFMELYLQRVHNTPDPYQISQMTFNLHHNFKNFHTLDATAQYFYYKHRYHNDFMFMVSYKVPFDIPVGRRSEIGTLHGYVYDPIAQSPIPQATINCNGLRATTDDSGYFSFRSLPAGEHQVKTEILPNHLITQNHGHEPVTVIGGRNNLLTLPVVANCCIEGDVLIYAIEESLDKLKGQLEDKNQIRLVELGGSKGVKVFISKDDNKEIYSTITDSKGHFIFSKLRPGNWHLWVSTSHLPKFHDLNMNHLVFDLEPGKQQKVTFKIIPQEKKVHSFE